MNTWQACLWGLLGVGLVEFYALWKAVPHAEKPRWPWVDEHGRPQVWAYVIAAICRCAMGGGLNAVYAASHQITGPLGAVTLGIAAPLIIKQMAVREDAEPPALPDPATTEQLTAPIAADAQEAEDHKAEAADVH